MSLRTDTLTADDRVVRGARWSFRVSHRTTVVCGVLAGTLLVLLIAALMIGQYVVTPVALVETLLGRPPERLDGFFVLGAACRAAWWRSWSVPAWRSPAPCSRV